MYSLYRTWIDLFYVQNVCIYTYCILRGNCIQGVYCSKNYGGKNMAPVKLTMDFSIHRHGKCNTIIGFSGFPVVLNCHQTYWKTYAYESSYILLWLDGIICMVTKFLFLCMFEGFIFIFWSSTRRPSGASPRYCASPCSSYPRRDWQSLPWAASKQPDSNPGLLHRSLVRCHWATSPPGNIFNLT
jgi:hypothetical protein